MSCEMGKFVKTNDCVGLLSLTTRESFLNCLKAVGTSLVECACTEAFLKMGIKNVFSTVF